MNAAMSVWSTRRGSVYGLFSGHAKARRTLAAARAPRGAVAVPSPVYRTGGTPAVYLLRRGVAGVGRRRQSGTLG